MSAAHALNWMIDILESSNISYLVCGGLAASAYGATRPLNDIDIFVPADHYADIVEYGRPYITYGPQRYRDQFWDVDYVQFCIEGIKLEAGSDELVQIYDALNNEWRPLSIDFNRYSVATLLGRDVRVMHSDDLIKYKRMLAREVDLLDIAQIQEQHATTTFTNTKTAWSAIPAKRRL